jgi:hypothetical protein
MRDMAGTSGFWWNSSANGLRAAKKKPGQFGLRKPPDLRFYSEQFGDGFSGGDLLLVGV